MMRHTNTSTRALRVIINHDTATGEKQVWGLLTECVWTSPRLDENGRQRTTKTLQEVKTKTFVWTSMGDVVKFAATCGLSYVHGQRITDAGPLDLPRLKRKTQIQARRLVVEKYPTTNPDGSEAVGTVSEWRTVPVEKTVTVGPMGSNQPFTHSEKEWNELMEKARGWKPLKVGSIQIGEPQTKSADLVSAHVRFVHWTEADDRNPKNEILQHEEKSKLDRMVQGFCKKLRDRGMLVSKVAQAEEWGYQELN